MSIFLEGKESDEDTITCLLFSPTTGSDLELWEELCKQVNLTIQTLSKHYIWQRDEFHVYIPIQNSEKGCLHLESTTCFGDNIEDEWYIVYLIFELTKLFDHLIVYVKDNDGDFLLIESANYLPTWASPETSENRVFIYKNQVHIIPPEVVSLDCKLELQDAINLIKQKPELTQASEQINKAILDRVGKYPEKSIDNMHTAVVTLPSELATLLSIKPSLIAPIVNAYCHHDILEAKYCKNISFEDCVTVKITFTKFLYAMLMSSKVITYIENRGEQDNKCAQIGLKLLCGYHIIRKNSSQSNILSTKEYSVFLNNLKQNGYFKENIEGSQEYNYLLSKAKDYFLTVECPVSSHFSQTILQIMSSDSYLKTKHSLKENAIATDHNCLGDNEDWMNIEPDQLNDLLQSRYGKKSKLNKNDIISSEAVTAELSDFLKKTSDFEGIETGNKSEDNDIDFDSNQFVDCLEKMLKLLSTGNNDDDVDGDFSDYDSNDDDGVSMCESSNSGDEELRSKLTEPTEVRANIFTNIVKSMKEEKAYTGPTSNLLRNIGVNKTDILDSDDDLM